VDIYSVVQKVMLRPEYKQAQDELKGKWEPRLEAIRADFRKLESDLQVLPQNDPRAQEVIKAGRDKQAEFDKAAQDQNIEYEALSSKQLIDAYTQSRAAAGRVAEQKGYTHVFVNRPPDLAITSTTLGNALQEFLARPIIKSPAGDDLTRAVAGEMKVDLDAPMPNPGNGPVPNGPPAATGPAPKPAG
jgi:hypothetical protein